MNACKALVKVMQHRVKNVYYKSETTLPFKAELGQENGFIYGQTDDNIAVENGLKFHVDWLRGQKTGFFVDQRENCALLEHYAKGKSVLNMSLINALIRLRIFLSSSCHPVYSYQARGAKVINMADEPLTLQSIHVVRPCLLQESESIRREPVGWRPTRKGLPQ